MKRLPHDYILECKRLTFVSGLPLKMLRIGQKLLEQIDRAIQTYDRLLLVLSKDSLESEWVMTEIRKARRIGKESTGENCFPFDSSIWSLFRHGIASMLIQAQTWL